MPTGPMYMRPWHELMDLVKRGDRFLRPWAPPAEIGCAMVLTLVRNGNGRLNVRCRCMAGTVNTPRQRYYNYDALGEAADITAARELWDAHLADKGEDHGASRSNGA